MEGLVLGGGGGGRPDYLQKLKVPEGYEKMMDYTIVIFDTAVSKPNFASKYAFESSRRDLHNELLCTALQSQFFVKFCQKKMLDFNKTFW